MIDMDTARLRAKLIETARAMNARGINVNKSGNVSCRAMRGAVTGFLITPTGVPYEALAPEDLVFMALEEPLSLDCAIGRLSPSSEWEMHARVYLERPDLCAVVHTHSAYATALACQALPIPAFHYMVASAGGASIDVVPYRTFGTSELAVAAAAGLRSRNACLLSHHGVLAAGKSLERALSLAAEVENLAHQYVIVRSLGEPKLIEDAEMMRVIDKFRTYGQPQKRLDAGEGKA